MIHHIGYVVGDLQAEIPRWAESTGAGPFFLIEHMEFDEVTFRGNPADYDHSSAFGAWGPIIVELTQVHSVAPEALRVELGHRHVAWLADSLEDERERLARPRPDALPHGPDRAGVGRLARRRAAVPAPGRGAPERRAAA